MCNRCPDDVPNAAVHEVSSRRGFFKLVAGVLSTLLVLTGRRAAAKQLAVNLGDVAALQKVGGSALLKVNEVKVLFIRDGEQSIHALNSTCTHKKCTVKFKAETGKMHCPCHKSAYDLEGKVLDGPAPKPLTAYPAKLDGDRIIITMPD